MTNEERLELINQVRLEDFTDRAYELNELAKRFGPEFTKAFLEIRAAKNEKDFQEIGQELPNNNIQGLLDTLWTWCEEAGFTFTYDRTETTLQMRVTYCPYAEIAKKINMTEWGFNCFCCDDFSMTKGFNEKITFSRTKTLMEGHDCCDHFYSEQSNFRFRFVPHNLSVQLE